MNTGLENVVVGSIVVAALLYSIWRLGPSRLRRAVLDRLSVFFPSLAGRSEGGGCESCKSCAPSTPVQAASGNAVPSQAKPLHFVPASKLRR